MQPLLSAHRDRVIEQLSAGFGADRIEVDELDRRLTLAHAADTPAALDALVVDLAPATPVSALALVPVKRLRVVLGSIERVGSWAVPARLAARVLWGNLVLDLREAHLGPGVTTIDVHVTMGNVEVVLPPDVAVEVDANPILGNVEDRSAPLAPSRLVRISGRVTLGNIEVTTLARGETRRDARRRQRWERRAHRRMLRHAHRHRLPAPFDLR